MTKESLCLSLLPRITPNLPLALSFSCARGLGILDTHAAPNMAILQMSGLRPEQLKRRLEFSFIILADV
jgi:hypothetical protein